MSDPHGWIQWKGTEVCMDVHCTCGELTHIDADFCYQVKCCACGQLYQVDPNVRLKPVDKPNPGLPEPWTTTND